MPPSHSRPLLFVEKVDATFGAYLVFFDRDIRQCLLTVTIGYSGDSGDVRRSR